MMLNVDMSQYNIVQVVYYILESEVLELESEEGALSSYIHETGTHKTISTENEIISLFGWVRLTHHMYILYSTIIISHTPHSYNTQVFILLTFFYL